LFDNLLRECDNVSFDFKHNGEERVLNILTENGLDTVFDVGANVGEFSREVRRRNPNSVIYAFEIIPQTFRELKKNTQGIEKIVIFNIGLFDENKSIKMHIGKTSVVATAFKIEGMEDHNEYYQEVQSCEVIKGCDFIQNNRIEKIDFLKIDTEGSDLRVIKGFEEEINKVKVIQFEYGIFNIQSKDLLIDFYNYLEVQGFKVGKVFPNHVDFSKYHFSMENFHGGNFIAVDKKESTLIEQLSFC
jgi:FkbM family methyltransferase